MIKLSVVKDRDGELTILHGDSNNLKYWDGELGKDHPVEVIISTMAEFEKMKDILFSQKRVIEKLRCCGNCRNQGNSDHCIFDAECGNNEAWESIQ